jgi:hypothetical protein
LIRTWIDDNGAGVKVVAVSMAEPQPNYPASGCL